jgi:hypothetical protein
MLRVRGNDLSGKYEQPSYELMPRTAPVEKLVR